MTIVKTIQYKRARQKDQTDKAYTKTHNTQPLNLIKDLVFKAIRSYSC